MTDPKGNPCCLRESVERLPTRPKYSKVRALSANVGSATAGWFLAAPEPACFPAVDEDISVLPHEFGTCSRILLWRGSLGNKLTRCGFETFVQSAQGIRTGEKKGERRSITSQAPLLLRQRKPYLTGSPPSRQERRCRQECRVPRVYRAIGKMS